MRSSICLPPKNEKEVRGFLGRIQYISRFIAQLTPVCAPIFKLLRKNSPKEWNEECKEAFDQIKKYLSNPPVLVPPVPVKPLLLYLSVTDSSMGAVLGQYEEDGKKEQAIYYISKTLSGYESKYSTLEKTCISLVWATQRLRHYMLSHSAQLLSRMDPLKYLFEKPMISGRTARWQLLLEEFDITYVTQKSIKGRAIADHLEAQPILDCETLITEFPDEHILIAEQDDEGELWKMYFYGAMNPIGKGAGAILISPDEVRIPISIRLNCNCTNNMDEYEACIAGLRAALELSVKKLKVYGDSLLIVNQTQKVWKIKEEKLVSYHECLMRLVEKFDCITFHHLYRDKNQFANVLAALASLIPIPGDSTVKPIEVARREQPSYCYAVEIEAETNNGDPWYHDIKNYLEDRTMPDGLSRKERRYIQCMSFQYMILGGVLYKKYYDEILLRCVDGDEPRRLLREIHEGICGPHMNGHMLSRKILRMGYYWTTMESDCFKYVKRCHKCQIHANLLYLTPTELHPLTSPWHFSVWGIDVIGKLNPSTSNGHEYIIVAIDYFTKWVEAISVKNPTGNQTVKFLALKIWRWL
ncbi:uncharacterized protein LOC113288000 [Papaver somniferum]|uniref:uncharacterized protein LOC113288000 n=1 Tax=Papaver somniferum TaxID=3469 RepID=UPI000E7001D8|nr:uncharacterized protein LOC113288000 [Papaver somniferum]